MSANTAHTSNGVLLHAGEFILLSSDNVFIRFINNDSPIFNGCKNGRIYLTSHRLIFKSKEAKDDMQSFSAPFIAISNLQLKQPVLAPNYVRGKVSAQPNGNFIDDVEFEIYFKTGGAIEFGKALSRAASIAQWYMQHNYMEDLPPPYTPPTAWHEAPPPAYEPPSAHTTWLPKHQVFTEPPPNTVFVSDSPPPYVGIGEAPPAVFPKNIAEINQKEESKPTDVFSSSVYPK